jgi:hypothetical protein
MGEFNLKIMSAEVFISLQLSYLFMVSSALDLWVRDLPTPPYGHPSIRVASACAEGRLSPTQRRGFYRLGFSNLFKLGVGELDVSSEEE